MSYKDTERERQNPVETYAEARSKVQSKMRPIILQRDGSKCVACPSTEKLELCHIFPLAKMLRKHYTDWEWLNSEENMVTLCERCHAIIDDRFGALTNDPRVCESVAPYHDVNDPRTWTISDRRRMKRKFEAEREKILKIICEYLKIPYTTFRWHQGARYGKL